MSTKGPMRDGSDTLKQTARPGVVALTLAKHTPILVILLLPPAIWAALEDAWDLALALAAPATIALLAYLSVLRIALPDDLRGVEALVTLALIFLFSSLVSIPAFVSLGMSPVDALFEGMSGVTTTGLSVAANPDNWPFAAHVFRAWIQWIGGLVMATAVLALILPPGVTARRLGRAGIDQGDRISSTRRQARQLLIVYLCLTAAMTCITAVFIPDLREALVLTLSGISTGGFAPRSDSLSSYSLAGQSVVILTCLLGAISFLTYILITQGKLRDAWQLGSINRLVTVSILLGSLLFFAWALSPNEIRTDLSQQILNLLSAISTAGYSAGPVDITGAALVILLIAMALGADVGSTGGGLKIARVGLLFRSLHHSIRAPSMPRNAVVPLRQDGKKVEDGMIIAIAGLIAIYVSTLLLVWFHFLIHGHPPVDALFDVISALSTVGLSVGVVGNDLSPDLKLSLTFAMWLGRLEFIAVLVLFAPGTWLKKG